MPLIAHAPRSILITGARKGIGLGLARHFLDQNWKVFGCSRKPAQIAHESYTHFETDVADEKAALSMFARIRGECGGLDALINNAGIASMNAALLTPLPRLREILDTNVVGSFLFCKEAARLMVPRRGGRIVNFSTVAVPLDLEGEAAYVASKAAVVSLTRVLAREFAPFGITVNAIGPTPTETDLIKGVPREKLDSILARQAIRRLGTLDDIVNGVDFFLRPESSFVTGQTLYLGGV